MRERVKTAWKKWKEISAVICDRKISVRLRLKLYRTIVRPVLLYEAEMWAIRKEVARKNRNENVEMDSWNISAGIPQ